MLVGARIKHVTIQNIALDPYIPEALHVELDRQRTDRTAANTSTNKDSMAGSLNDARIDQ